MSPKPHVPMSNPKCMGCSDNRLTEMWSQSKWVGMWCSEWVSCGGDLSESVCGDESESGILFG